MNIASKPQLQGWKEIASFLGRDERTAKRWEKQRGLPVRRIPGTARASVFCVTAELQAWLLATPTPPGAPADIDTPTLTPAVPTPAEPPPPAAPLPPEPHPTTPHPRPLAAVAGLVAALLLLLIHPHLSVAPAARHIPSAAAQELSLQGRYLAEQRTPAALQSARDHFHAAIAADPLAAPAYAGLAHTELLLREYSTVPDADAYREALAAARRAVALDPRLSEAHTALAFIAFFWQWDAATAEHEFQTALRLDPDCALAHHWYGSMLLHQARFPEALHQLILARTLLPSSTAILALQAYALGLDQHRDQATTLLHQLGSVHDSPPNQSTSTDDGTAALHRTLAVLSLIEPRDPAQYLAELRRFATLRHDTTILSILSSSETELRRGGEPALWAAMLARERQLHPAHPTYLTAELQAALGHDPEALQTLNDLATTRDPSLIGIGIDPFFAHLRATGSLRPIAARMQPDPTAAPVLLASAGEPLLRLP